MIHCSKYRAIGNAAYFSESLLQKTTKGVLKCSPLVSTMIGLLLGFEFHLYACIAGKRNF